MASSNIEEEQKAKKFVKSNVDLLIEKFASLEEYPPSNKPFTLFMAGSPGAGKTEFSKSLVNIIKQREKAPIIRIDADEI